MNISFSFIFWLKVTLHYLIQSISLLIFVFRFRFLSFNFDYISIVLWGKIFISLVFRFRLLFQYCLIGNISNVLFFNIGLFYYFKRKYDWIDFLSNYYESISKFYFICIFNSEFRDKYMNFFDTNRFDHYANEKAQVMFKTWVCKGR